MQRRGLFFAPLAKWVRRSPLINVLPVTDLQNQHLCYAVFDLVDNSIIANTYAVKFTARKLFHSDRAGIDRKGSDFFEETFPDRGFQFTNLAFSDGRNL